jgi:hypothetical protein
MNMTTMMDSIGVQSNSNRRNMSNNNNNNKSSHSLSYGSIPVVSNNSIGHDQQDESSRNHNHRSTVIAGTKEILLSLVLTALLFIAVGYAYSDSSPIDAIIDTKSIP